MAARAQEGVFVSIWVIERKHPTENENGWKPFAMHSYIRERFAHEGALRLNSSWWEHRAVEYVRKEPA